MRAFPATLLLLGALVAGAPLLAETAPRPPEWWANPVYADEQASVRAAEEEAKRNLEDADGALRLFLQFNLTDKEVPSPEFAGERREEANGFLLTWPGEIEDRGHFESLLRRVKGSVATDRVVLGERLTRFGLPAPEGLVYVKFVPTVDALNDEETLSVPGQDRKAGVTILCRYVVLPLSHSSAAELQQALADASRQSTASRGSVLENWAAESVEEATDTFRHELVHVWVNTAVGVPDYSDQKKFPTWFDEGMATYLGDSAHASLSTAYREYQKSFFYLVQRDGPELLGKFVSDAVREKSAPKALLRHYGLRNEKELQQAARTWRHRSDVAGTFFFLAFVVLFVLAYRMDHFPFIGGAQVILAVLLLWWAFSGTPEYLQGLNGPGAVLGAKAGLVIAAGFLIWRAALRFVEARRARIETLEPSPYFEGVGR